MRAIVPFAMLLFGAVLATAQSIIPSIDTMPPLLSRTSAGCGVYEFTATDLRNIPDPPLDPPRPNDQVETGIASVSIFDSPRSVNAKLTLITDVIFPREDAYKRFTFRIEPIDKTKRATVYLFVRDHAGNLASQQLVIEPTLPTLSTNEIGITLRVGRHDERTVTLRNETSAPQVVQGIGLVGSLRMSILAGGTTPLTIPAGGTHDVVIAYDPTLASEEGDEATLTITTECGVGTVAVRGVGLVGRLATEDWNAGQQSVGTRICKPSGFIVKNEGTAPVTVTGFSSSNAEITVTSDITPANPLILAPGSEYAVTELCYEPLTAGLDDAVITVLCDADDGDVSCIVRGEGVLVSSVADAISVDAAETDVMLINVHGQATRAVACNGRIDAGMLPSGAYYLILRHPRPHAVPVLILR